MNFESSEEWITAKEAAARKGIHRNNIARAIREGRLKGVMVGGRYLIRRSDLEQWEPVGHRPKKDAPAVGRASPLALEPPDSGSEAEPGKEEPALSSLLQSDDTPAADFRRELAAYLESGETDLAARARLMAFPGGAEALAKVARIRQLQSRLAGDDSVVETYLRWKREEIEAERRRDEARLG
jgi:excisionase family DNA binding protein